MRRLALAVLAIATGCNTICEGSVCDQFVPGCPTAPAARLELEHRWSMRTDEQANPEIVGFIPGEQRAIVTSRIAARITEVFLADDRLAFGRSRPLELPNSSSELTTVAVAPSGEYAAIAVSDTGDGVCDGDDDCAGGQCVGGLCACYPGAVPGCACSSVRFVDVRPGSFGTTLGSIAVGYTPDGGRFSQDGRYFVTADEDDSEDRPCKPVERFGGSVSVIEIGAPAACATPSIALPSGARACRIRQVPITHARLSEPEDVTLTTTGLVVASLQDTDELVVFPLLDPSAPVEIIELSGRAGPDGLAASLDGRYVAAALEFGDALAIVDLATRTVVTSHRVGDDVPIDFNRDERGVRRVHEPEQVAWFESQGAEFIAMSLQESHAIVAYRVDTGQVSFDSIAPVGVDFEAEHLGRVASTIGPEGIAARPPLFLSANEREGSITLLRARCPRD